MSDEVMHEYRVVIDVHEDEFWDAQELVDGFVFLTPGEADARRGGIDLSRYPEGTTTFVEHRTYTDWRPL